MPGPTDNDSKLNETKEWTVMIFLAGDNALSPSMISQLKAIKDAGFQLNSRVLVHFDPNEQGAPTRIFDVGSRRKRKEIQASNTDGRAPESGIGDGRDPYVRNMVEDIVDPTLFAGPAAVKLATKLQKSDDIKADEALELFLGFCFENFAADHYILFLVGHGMIVGNDAFLPDDYPNTGITLKRLAEILGKSPIFDLIGLHSCSMSGVEVAYQLKGMANYLMATEGPSFVGSWPYRQLLKKIFNAVDYAKAHNINVDVPALINSLYYLCLYNGTDFISAGYSSEICLCKLGTEEVRELTSPIQTLVRWLKAGLQDPYAKKCVLLAHWDSQSYWQETYSDLYDFCRCLRERCDETNELQKFIKTAAKDVMDSVEALVVHSDWFGPTYEYSHGLSIYFPWSPPIEYGYSSIMKQYEHDYAFTQELGNDSWFTFLAMYFKETLRESRETEDGFVSQFNSQPFIEANASFDVHGLLSNDPTKPDPRVGIECNCGIIKNHPRDFSISPAALKAFD